MAKKNLIRDPDQAVLLSELEDQPFLSLFERGTGIEDEEVGTDATITEPFDPTLIRVSAKTITIDLLVARLRRNEINLAPDFQRKAGIWDNGAQSRLIESLLIRIPLPAFYMDASNDDNWIVVDGLQRLTTLKRFIVDKEFELCDLEFLKPLSGKRYDALPRNFQRRIEETQVTLYLIEPGTPSQVKFNIFKRINTGGLPLSPQEIRHALNQGNATQLLKRLADSLEFKQATAGSIRDERMADREFVLRFLSFVMVPYTSYRSKDFDSFLNDRMAEINKMDEPELKRFERLFATTMINAYQLFGSDAFRKRYNPNHARYPVNKALFESWSVALSALSVTRRTELIARREILKEKFMATLTEDRDFEGSISTGTGDIRKLRCRFETVERIVRETLA
ncbi:MAG TPA: DUF262 domain-containing protein [Candidatus Angelobacter sp.]|nr:DUF262 domain-containing protein [Candidatus Angelobacter sp.]